jgi:hypothetical protein
LNPLPLGEGEGKSDSVALTSILSQRERKQETGGHRIFIVQLLSLKALS